MEKKNKKRSGGIAVGILKIGLFVLAVLIVSFILSEYVVERARVTNHSMESTLESDDGILIDKITYRFREPERFDIIVFKQTGTGEELVKRVIGLPFETVQIVDGKFLIDGEPIDDVKGVDAPEYAGLAQSPVELSAGEYFVVGDNREESIDSRYEQVGIVTSTRITGRVFMRIIPFSKIRFF
ncbi:MAG: signal peptidase I [Lachnospiraceae bacterium]|nr:signal peptidase I [Lachnospiraceae bacterium]